MYQQAGVSVAKQDKFREKVRHFMDAQRGFSMARAVL
jgi:hypothetical protein